MLSAAPLGEVQVIGSGVRRPAVRWPFRILGGLVVLFFLLIMAAAIAGTSGDQNATSASADTGAGAGVTDGDASVCSWLGDAVSMLEAGATARNAVSQLDARGEYPAGTGDEVRGVVNLFRALAAIDQERVDGYATVADVDAAAANAITAYVATCS